MEEVKYYKDEIGFNVVVYFKVANNYYITASKNEGAADVNERKRVFYEISHVKNHLEIHPNMVEIDKLEFDTIFAKCINKINNF